MKLRNKQTGEIVEVESIGHAKSLKEKFGYQVTLSWKVDEHLDTCKTYNSLAELNAEWEDAQEEPKEYWCISQWGEIVKRRKLIPIHGENMEAEHKEIGNYFETKEEAEKAVRKLKAWKRLKDKGFRFKEWESYEETSGLSFPDRCIVNSYTAIFDFNKHCRKYEIEKEVKDDLDLLFGGEE